MATNRASTASPNQKPFGIPHVAHRRSPPAQPMLLPRQQQRKFSNLSDEHEVRSNKRARACQLQRHDSHGSDSTESASKWFDSVNKNVETGQRQSPPMSDEPPFYLSSHQAVYPSNFVTTGTEGLFGAEHQDHDDSENDDLRGVIDDLTVENKRLKTLLKSRKTKHSPSLEAHDRLFELRVHDLPANKKRELEQLLRNFATTVSTRPTSVLSSSATYGSGQIHPSEASSRSGQQQVAKLLHTDSGYASNSGSGHRSSPVSNGGRPSIPISKSSRNKSIKNYLHGILDTPLPSQSRDMAENAKMVVVVRRLEQLFDGKHAAPGQHNKPVQQQEVSQSAARADATGNQKLKKSARARETYMLPHNATVNLDAMNVEQETSPPRKIRKSRRGTSSSSASDAPGSASLLPDSPKQRPTRSFDLDIQRAQIANKNIEYLRHLGLSSPHIQGGGDTTEHPWLYLNLLVSMAQLHTINVTPAFIRQAIKKMSTKFELSTDGQKVRWKGGSKGTTSSREEDNAMESPNDGSIELTDDVAGSSNNSLARSSSNNMVSTELSSGEKNSGGQTSGSYQQISTRATLDLPASMPQNKSGSEVSYRPLFYKAKKYSPEESYLDSTSSSYSSGDSNDLVWALSRSNLDHRRYDEGAITFFSNPYFCSDASAESAPTNWKPMRQVLPWVTLGVQHECLDESPIRYHNACYFTPQFAAKPCDAQLIEPPIAFSQTQITAAGEDETQPIELPVSSIGGVYPEDNFALDVKVGRQLHTEVPSSERVPFTRTRKRKRYSYRTLRSQVLSLLPSKLPPPSYSFGTYNSSLGNPDMMDDSESEGSESAGEDSPTSPAFLHHWSTGSSDNGDEEDSSSIDMLAMARAADPDHVAAAERDFMITGPDAAGRVEGSLVATVGASGSSSSEAEDDLRSDIRSDEDVNGSDMDVDDDDDDDDE